MKTSQVMIGGQEFKLDRMIGKGGEGEVYTVVGKMDYAIKLYSSELRPKRSEKIGAMVRNGLFNRSPLVAFPTAVVNMRDGSFAGFAMKLMHGYQAIHELYAPGSRKHNFPQADYRFLARTATNVARAFASVHLNGCVVGDINHSGIFVSKDATAALIDADSFQFSDGKQQFLCSVGVPEYTPPELQGKSLDGVVRTKDHDAFGMAVILFQILMMGRHPFVGTVRRGDIPPLHENIANFRYVYAENIDVGMDQPPGTPGLTDFSPELAKLFDRAFSRPSAGGRPTAQDWVVSLDRFEANLSQCEDNSLHYGPQNASECPWCEMERQVGTLLFLPYLPAGAPLPALNDPGKSFNIEMIWARITRVAAPSSEQIRPTLPILSLTPSNAAEEAKSKKQGSPAIGGLIALIAAAVLVVVLPNVWVLALLIAIGGLMQFSSDKASPINATKFVDAFTIAQNEWYRELEGWRRRVGLNDLETLREQLQTAKQQYLELVADEKRQLESYRSQRHERQLQAFLENFDLSKASINGIGAGRITTLSSYGIDTAADLIESRLRSVPGFGSVLIERLLEWRAGRAKRFVYNAAENDADRREAIRIRALTESKAASLRTQLVNGLQELEHRAHRFLDFSKKEDPLLAKIHGRVEQAKVDLIHLEIAIPVIAAPPARQYQPHARVSQGSSARAGHTSGVSTSWPYKSPPPTIASAGSPPLCPRCSSSMVRRVARRGSNSGNAFWGCSRFPNCKGVRPI